jgi:hypothetical protein
MTAPGRLVFPIQNPSRKRLQGNSHASLVGVKWTLLVANNKVMII